MKRLLSLIVFLCIYLTASVDAEPLQVGAILPLSGPVAESGVAAKVGIEMALAELGSDKIQFVFEDDGFDPKKTVAAFKKLTAVGDLDALLTLGSGTTNAIAPLSARQQLPTFTLALNVKAAIGNPYVIRATQSGHEVGQYIAQVLDKNGLARIAVIVAFSDQMTSIEKGLLSRVEPERVVVNESVAPDESDFKAVVTKMRNAKVDAVVILLLPGKIALFAKQAREQGITAPFIGNMFFDSANEVALSQGALIGSRYVTHEATDIFRHSYREKTGTDQFSGVAGVYYDLAKLLARGSSREGDLLEQMRSVAGYSGAMGALIYNAKDGDHYYSYKWTEKLIESANIFKPVGKVGEL